MRHIFSKYGGNLGTAGCVSFMFSEKGVVAVDNEDNDIDLDTFTEHVIEAGGDDFTAEDGVIEVYTETGSAVSETAENLTKQGYKILSAQNEQIPANYTELTDDEQIKKMTILLEMLDDNDDVQNVWHNWD
jgi:transcriptional/translational regulatory protein YebC/TACO1